jgi:hypothetical protein
MPNILTSWKEIGLYLGKGVRTVQRWEREAGLPVRRQTHPSPHAIIAVSEELDAWARSRTRGPSGAVASSLHKEIAALHAENDQLRARLDILEAEVLAVTPADLPSAIHKDRLPANRSLADSARVEIRGTRFAARQARSQALRARLSFASTLCALGERRVRDGDLAPIWRARHTAQEIQKSLEIPGYVPEIEVEHLRILLRKLASRIDRIARAFNGAAGDNRPRLPVH